MNQEYIYSHGQVLIRDDLNKEKIVDYYDNLDQVLIQENIIEEMMNKKEDLEKNISEKLKPYTIKRLILDTVLGTLLMAFLMNILVNSFGPIDGIKDLYVQLYEPIISISIFLPINIIGSCLKYIDKKESLKEKRGKKIELELLNRELEDAKKYLEYLKSNKTCNKKKRNFDSKQINDLEQLKLLKKCLLFYKQLGYNEQKYLKAYQEGKLDYSLNNYDQEEISFAKEYFKEKINKKR